MENIVMQIVAEWWDWIKKSAYITAIFFLISFVRFNVFGKPIELKLPSYNVIQEAQASEPVVRIEPEFNFEALDRDGLEQMELRILARIGELKLQEEEKEAEAKRQRKKG